jgi:hypothetical protein
MNAIKSVDELSPGAGVFDADTENVSFSDREAVSLTNTAYFVSAAVAVAVAASVKIC